MDLGWPETDPPSRAYLDRLSAALAAAGGPGLASFAIAPRLASLAPILALGRQGKGPPCDLQADVLPAIHARSARAPPGSIKSWDYFVPAIVEARDRRLSGAPIISPQEPRRHDQHRPNSADARFAAKQDNYASSFAAAQRVAERYGGG